MSQRELLIFVVAALEAAEIPYMITGSTVSSLQGRPRSTHDIDIVVGLSFARVPSLVTAFAPPRFYVEELAVRQAIASGSMFNIIDSEGGDKVDFWLLKPDAFAQSSFRRRYRETGAGIQMYVSQPEDTILSKLLWAKLSGGSEKQMADCLAVYEINYSNIDHEYLKEWAQRLEVMELLQRILDDADTSDDP